MERLRRSAIWMRSAYLVYGILFVTTLGGVIQILAIANDLNYGLVYLLELNEAGPQLHGKYLFPKNWLAVFIVFVSMLLLFPATALLRLFVESNTKEEGLSPEILALRQDLDDAMRYASNITSYIYPSENKRTLRSDIIEVRERYAIHGNGDTEGEVTITLESVHDPAHFYMITIRGDPESGEVRSLRQLNLQVFDLDTGQKLDWLPIQNEATKKAFAVFFPEVQPGGRKKICVNYRWPRFLGKLIDLGVANFDWYYLSKIQETPAKFRGEWTFDSSLAPLECRILGQPAKTAKLTLTQNGPTISWIYEDPAAILENKTAIEFLSLRRA